MWRRIGRICLGAVQYSILCGGTYFLFPWAVVFNDLGLLAFVEMAIFLIVLMVGLAYVWKKSDLDWVKYNVKYGRGRYASLIEKTPKSQES